MATDNFNVSNAAPFIHTPKFVLETGDSSEELETAPSQEELLRELEELIAELDKLEADYKAMHSKSNQHPETLEGVTL